MNVWAIAAASAARKRDYLIEAIRESKMSKDLIDKARAWDAISQKSQEISELRMIIHDLSDGISGTLQKGRIDKMELALIKIRLLSNHITDMPATLAAINKAATEALRH